MRKRPTILESGGAALLLLMFACGVGAQNLQDPMRPADAAPAPTLQTTSTTLKLEGVISGSIRVAIVNGRLARVGDVIAGATIVEVLADGLRYSRAGRIQTILLPGVHAIATLRVASSAEAKP